MGADQPADHCGLGLTQLRELRGHMGDWAVVLTELTTTGQARCRGRVALAGQCAGQRLSAVEPVGAGGGDSLSAPFLQSGQLILGECGDRLGASAARQMAQSGDREVVVGMREAVSAHAGEREHPSGTSATTTGPVWCGAPLDPHLSLECVEVPADRGGRDAEFGAEVDRTQRPLAPEQIDHPIASTTVVGAGSAEVGPNRGVIPRKGQDCGFHNNIVTYLPEPFHQGCPNLM